MCRRGGGGVAVGLVPNVLRFVVDFENSEKREDAQTGMHFIFWRNIYSNKQPKYINRFGSSKKHQWLSPTAPHKHYDIEKESTARLHHATFSRYINNILSRSKKKTPVPRHLEKNYCQIRQLTYFKSENANCYTRFCWILLLGMCFVCF